MPTRCVCTGSELRQILTCCFCQPSVKHNWSLTLHFYWNFLFNDVVIMIIFWTKGSLKEANKNGSKTMWSHLHRAGGVAGPHLRWLWCASWQRYSKFQILAMATFKFHIFWEGHLTFVCMYCRQKLGGDFAKPCGLLRINELYQISQNILNIWNSLFVKHACTCCTQHTR